MKKKNKNFKQQLIFKNARILTLKRQLKLIQNFFILRDQKFVDFSTTLNLVVVSSTSISFNSSSSFFLVFHNNFVSFNSFDSRAKRRVRKKKKTSFSSLTRSRRQNCRRRKKVKKKTLTFSQRSRIEICFFFFCKIIMKFLSFFSLAFF